MSQIKNNFLDDLLDEKYMNKCDECGDDCGVSMTHLIENGEFLCDKCYKNYKKNTFPSK
jgi:formylmethanofuran dehydrogenase subunit E